MSMILTAILYVTAIGAVCAGIICIFSKLLAVQVDERVEEIMGYMPGTNCGACGYPGCEGYVADLLADRAVKVNLCPPGGPELVRKLSELLGVEAEVITQKVAVVHCQGDRDTQQKKMEYSGIETCKAAKALFGGAGACAFGCLGYADCQVVCPKDAIRMENGLAQILFETCTGCGLCVKACPNNLITMEDNSVKTIVLCENREKGGIARKKCAKACISCRKCERECPAAAIVVKDNLAKIDPELCTGCGHCVEICITNCVQCSPFATRGK